MNQIYRNPAAWASVVILALMMYLYFREFPIVASVSIGSLILYISVRQIRSSLRLRRFGYRIKWSGPENFHYEELTATGEIRYLTFGCGHITRKKVGIYWPNAASWNQRMPDWAKDRREEIFERIRTELGERLVKVVEEQ